MLAKYKDQFHSKSRRLRLLDGKFQPVEDDSHLIAQDIQRMNALLKGYDNKPDQTETGDLPKLDAEEFITLDVVYPVKDKDDTSSTLVIFSVDEVEDIVDTVDLTGNDIEPVK